MPLRRARADVSFIEMGGNCDGMNVVVEGTAGLGEVVC